MAETLTLPPFVDGHVHFREPGNNPAETIMSGSEAAAMGGVGMVADMSNNAPQPTCTVDAISQKHAIARYGSAINFSTALGAQPEYDNLGEMSLMLPLSIFVKLYGGPTTNIDRDHDYEAHEFDQALDSIQLHDKGKLIVFHSGADNYRDFIGHAAGDRGLRVRLAHVNKMDQVRAVLEAQSRGWDVTSAICPHTMLLTSHDVYTQSSFADMQPPLVKQNDTEELFDAFSRGDIQELETDHAPHSKVKKMTSALTNPLCSDEQPGSRCCGVPGVELAAPLLFWQAKIGRISIERIVEAYSTIPADRMRIKLNPQSSVSWNMDAFRVDEDYRIRSKAGWTPYLGKMAVGEVEEMKLGGLTVVRNGEVVNYLRSVVTGIGEEI